MTAKLVRLFVTTAAVAAASIPPAIAFAPEDEARLDSGEPVVRVVPGGGGPIDGQVQATMIIPAPAAAVYSALTECQTAPVVFPSLKSCRVIETGPQASWDVREHRVASWASFLPDMSTLFHSDYVPDRSISFRLLSGDIQHLDGAWTLEPVKGGTRVTYEARVGFHALVPSFLVRQSLTSDVPKFLAAIRDESVRRAPRFAKQN